ncbi:hypothetical protein MSAN_01069000 [Mycena sanguinolenta]|uniref:Uncharacterized protein n=1 Tax=Mycena sanguinolenta TaxID=230812 RepID=A0A8H6YUH0_9AGAR|nr:hypothetical protein MSAN_01069000 [Mycena sanguinolenta]
MHTPRGVAAHFPNLKTLHIRAYSSPEQETLDHLTTQLSHFKMMNYLALEDGRTIRYRNDDVSRDKLYALVTMEWASVCSTLEVCCICGLFSFIFRLTDVVYGGGPNFMTSPSPNLVIATVLLVFTPESRKQCKYTQ